MSPDKSAVLKPQKEKLDPLITEVAIVLIAGSLAPLLDSTMVNVAIKTIGVDLKTTLSVIQWVITGYILSMGLAVPVSGWATARFGGKKVYVFSLVLFFAGSVLSSVSWNIESLIVFRLVQGAGAGLMIPTLQTILVQAAGGRNLGRIMSIISIPALLGPILGPVLGGIIVNSLSWRWIFYVNIPVSMMGVALALWILPKDKISSQKQPLDLTGILLLSPAFAALIYGIAQISSHRGLTSYAAIVPLITGVILLVAFVVYALRTKKMPVLDLRLFKSGAFSASNIMLFLSGIVMNGTLFLLPLYYQLVRGESVLRAGLLLIPQGAGMLLTRSWVGSMADRTGSRLIVVVSLLVTAVGTIPFSFAGVQTNQFLLAAALLIRGAGLGGLLIPIMATAYVGLSKEQVPHASVATRIFQTIGGAFGTAILATVVQHQLSANVQAVAGAYNTAFWWSIGLTLLGVIPALFLPLRKNETGERR